MLETELAIDYVAVSRGFTKDNMRHEEWKYPLEKT